MENQEYNVKEHLHYGGIASFNLCPVTQDATGADIAVVGVPFDSCTTYRTGTRFGPRAIRMQSQLACCFHTPWDYELFKTKKVIDYGDVGYNVGAVTPATMLKETYEACKAIYAAGAKPMTLGGEHTIPFGPVRAAAEKYGTLALIHFDSHEDNTPMKDGNYTHANFAYELIQEGCIDPSHSAQVYIRTDMNKCGYHIFYAYDNADKPAEQLAAEIKEVVGDMPVYITFDIDALDPAFAPGTGTPVPGGPTSHHARKVLHNLRGLNVIGADVVEVAPAYDQAEITAMAGATIAQDLMYLMAEK